MDNEERPAKPGWKTTEFWQSAVVAIFGLVMASGVLPTEGGWGQLVGMAAAAISASSYSASRAAVKAK